MVDAPTAVATVQDVDITASMHTALARADLMPEQPMVETGSADANLLLSRPHSGHGL